MGTTANNCISEAAEPILRKMIRKLSGRRDIFVASTAVISCAAQTGFGEPVPALRTPFG